MKGAPHNCPRCQGLGTKEVWPGVHLLCVFCDSKGIVWVTPVDITLCEIEDQEDALTILRNS